MPLIQVRQVSEDTKTLIWHIQEEEQFFSDQLTPLFDEGIIWRNMIPKRKREYLASRYLLQLGLPAGLRISGQTKNQFGSPYLPEAGLFFGISHTTDYVACTISHRQTGCDIEVYQPRILKIAPKFMTNEELARAEKTDPMLKTQLIWSAKESAYKTWGKRGIDWKKDIELDIKNWNRKKGRLTGTIGKTETLTFYGEYQYFDDFVFVWTVRENE